MKEYLFRVEGVNLNHTVYDTSDISTIRGGGFYLLSRVGALARKYSEYLITEGASTAVFKVTTENPEEFRQGMLRFLYGMNPDVGELIPEMMFLVEHLENRGSFPELMAQLMGKIRLTQIQSPSLRLFPDSLKPSREAKMKPMGFDALNRVLPANVSDERKGNLSRFTHQRRGQGIILRERIYRELLAKEMGTIGDYEFTTNLQHLSKDDLQGNLSGKIAFIYMDGNKFGRLQRDFTMSQLCNYDTKIQDLKKKFLAAILRLSKENKSFFSHDRQVRLETLLWGGDELKLVVPAWLGWKVASLFYDLAEAEDMQIAAKIDDKEIICELTYAMGLVFANHNNPIRNVDQIAVDLADAVKTDLSTNKAFEYPAYNRKAGNRMYYAVLESFETLPSNYQTFVQSRYGREYAHQALSPEDIKSLSEFGELLDEYFSRSCLHSIAHACSADTAGEYHDALQRGLDICEADDKGKAKLIRAIENVTGTVIVNGVVKKGGISRIYRWRQVAELWDYLTWKEK